MEILLSNDIGWLQITIQANDACDIITTSLVPIEEMIKHQEFLP